MEVVVEWHGGNFQVLSRILTISPTDRPQCVYVYGLLYRFESEFALAVDRRDGSCIRSASFLPLRCFIFVEDKGRT